MSTLSEHPGSGNPTETRLPREDAKAQIDGILQHFDILPSKLERFIFKYIYIYLLGLFFPTELLFIIYLLSISSQLKVEGVLLTRGGLGALPVVAFIIGIWAFNVWRLSTPKTLHNLLEEKRIYVSDGDTNTSYLRFLEHYRDALASPKRYFLSSFLMLVISIPFAYVIVKALSVEHPNIFVRVLIVGYLLFWLLLLGGFYCLGIVTWIVYISGWSVRKLLQAFQLRIQPFHPDQCGGLTLLGNFCFGLVLPLLIGSGLLIGYILFALLAYSPETFGREYSADYLVLDVGFPLFLLLFYILPAIVLVFMLPLRDIHTKMVGEGKTNENIYVTRVEALREETQSLLDTNQVEAAKAVQEKKALVETLYMPYPTWPFHVRSKIFSTVLGVSGSLLIGVMTAALQQYILTLLFHTP
ncbi:MAG: hypothetical protein NVS4B12_15230 [Ktedonobacteraceae bacterium]